MFWEIVLILASVPVFRAVWMMMDEVSFFSEPAGVLFSLFAGLVLLAVGLVRIHIGQKREGSDAGQ